MLPIRKLISAMLPAVLLLGVCVSTGHAQETSADFAKASLQKGLQSLAAKDFAAARKSLLPVAADPNFSGALSQQENGQLTDAVKKADAGFTGQAAAKEKLADGRKAREGNQLAQAEKALAEAAASEYLADADRKAAQDELAAVRQALAAAPAAAPAAGATAPSSAAASAPEAGAPVVVESQPDDNILDIATRQREIQRKKAEFDMNEAVKRANEVLAKANSATEFDASSAAVSVAENVLTGNKTLFTPNETRDRQDQFDKLRTFIQTKRAVWEHGEVAKQKNEIAKLEEKRRNDAEDEIRRQVYKFSTDAQDAIHRKEYARALDIYDKILRIDPDNQFVRETRYMVQQIELLQREKGFASEEEYQRRQNLVDLRETEIPWYELLRYPKDWREITARRAPYMASSGNETEQNRQAMAKLKRKLANVAFDNTEFKNVIDWLQQVSNLSIQVKWTVLETAGITQATVVKSIHLTDVTVEKALRSVLDDIGGTTAMSYVLDEGVLTISTKEDLSGPRYRKTLVYDISDLLVTVPDFAGPRMNLNMTSGGGQGGSSSSGCSIFGGSCGGGQNANVVNRSEIVNQITRLIARTIDKESWMDPYGTGNVGSMSEMGGQLVITQTAENHRALLDLINQLRESKALQITIECRFLEVNTGFLNTIGIDLQTFLNIGAAFESAKSTYGIQTPTPGFADPIFMNGTFYGLDGGRPLPNTSPIGIAQQGMTWATGHNATGLVSPISGGITSIGAVGSGAPIPSVQVAGTFLDDIQVDFIVEATQANSMSRSLTAPRLTIYNGQQAYVTFATQQAYVSNVVPTIAENAVAYTATVSYIPTGTVLQVQGTVSADRRYVMMTVQPQISTNLGFTTYFSIVTGSTTDPNNPVALTGQGQIQLPNVQIQDLSTTVSVPDGGTLLLGGQKASGELEREQGAPILSKIPILRRLFTNEGKVRDEQTILILIKPKIIIHREEEERSFPGIASPGS